jgi:plasmid stabilization system protein ParE
MKSRTVIVTGTARADLLDIYEWLSETAGWETAARYIARIERFCMSFDLAGERGFRRDDVRQRLRVVGF